MTRRWLVFWLAACGVLGAGLAAGLALGAGGSISTPSDVTVITSNVYSGATPASPQGMSQAAANQAESMSSPPPNDGSNTGVTVLTSTTYPNATPASPQGMSQAAANQAASQAVGIAPPSTASSR